jgi:hypothetical protein
VAPSPNTPPTRARWLGPRPGVRIEGEWGEDHGYNHEHEVQALSFTQIDEALLNASLRPIAIVRLEPGEFAERYGLDFHEYERGDSIAALLQTRPGKQLHVALASRQRPQRVARQRHPRARGRQTVATAHGVRMARPPARHARAGGPERLDPGHHPGRHPPGRTLRAPARRASREERTRRKRRRHGILDPRIASCHLRSGRGGACPLSHVPADRLSPLLGRAHRAFARNTPRGRALSQRRRPRPRRDRGGDAAWRRRSRAHHRCSDPPRGSLRKSKSSSSSPPGGQRTPPDPRHTTNRPLATPAPLPPLSAGGRVWWLGGLRFGSFLVVERCARFRGSVSALFARGGPWRRAPRRGWVGVGVRDFWPCAVRVRESAVLI